MMTPAEIQKWLHPDGKSLIVDPMEGITQKELDEIYRVFQIGPDHWRGKEIPNVTEPEKEE